MQYNNFAAFSITLYIHRQVLEVVAAVMEKPKEQIAEQIYKNTCTLFNWTY